MWVSISINGYLLLVALYVLMNIRTSIRTISIILVSLIPLMVFTIVSGIECQWD